MLFVPFLAGCPVNLNRVPGHTDTLKDPETGAKYYLYVPSWHNKEQTWPIIVTCHGTIPWDTAWAQIHEWRGLAEKYGLIVIAPVLKATDSADTLSVKDQVRRQKIDEKAILNIVHRTISSLNGDPNRIYMAGWSGGGYTVYYTGLRNPQIFRALISRMGTFDARFLPGVRERIDPHQSLLICMAARDLPFINNECRAAFAWCRKNGMTRVHLREVVGVHQRRPKLALDYFKSVTKKFTFVRLNAVKGVGGDPLSVQFYMSADPKPRGFVWNFGDGKFSEEQSPRHKYSHPGNYVAKVTIISARSARTERSLKIDLKP